MPRPAGEVAYDLLPPSLPASLTAPVADPTVIAAHARSLAETEQAFSDEAQTIGLKAAFRKYGRSDALNRSEEHTSELQSQMRTSYAVFCLKKKKKTEITRTTT